MESVAFLLLFTEPRRSHFRVLVWIGCPSQRDVVTFSGAAIVLSLDFCQHHALNKSEETEMIVAITGFRMEVSRASLWVRLGALEVFVHRPPGLALRALSCERTGDAIEVWGLGFYGVLSRA